MKTLRKGLAALGILAIAGYLGAMVWLVLSERRLVFQPGPTLGQRRPAQPWQELAEFPAWVMPASGMLDSGMPASGMPASGMPASGMPAPMETAPWVVYLHGNASDRASRLNILHYERLRALGLNVIAPEYRGFAGAAGVPTEAGLAEDGRRAYDYLRTTRNVDARRIAIYGWSLGSAVAVTLASAVDEAAVILEGAPASIVAIGQQRYPYFPVRMLIRNPFDSIERIDRIGSPVLFLHSPEDVVVPIAEGRRLFSAAPEPKRFVEVSGGHIYASERDPRFFPAIRAFLQEQRLIP